MRTQVFKQAFFPIEDDTDKTEFKIKHLRSGEIAKITGKTQLQRFEFKPNEDGDVVPVPVLEMDTIKNKHLTAIESVTGWKNVYDSYGKVMEYSISNKTKFFNELSEIDYVSVIAHIDKSRATLSEQIKKQEDKQKKK